MTRSVHDAVPLALRNTRFAHFRAFVSRPLRGHEPAAATGLARDRDLDTCEPRAAGVARAAAQDQLALLRGRLRQLRGRPGGVRARGGRPASASASASGRRRGRRRDRHGGRHREAVEPCRGLAAGRHDHVAQAERGVPRDAHAGDGRGRRAHREPLDADPVAEVRDARRAERRIGAGERDVDRRAARAAARADAGQARDRRRRGRHEQRAAARRLAAGLHAHVAEADRRARGDGHVRHRRRRRRRGELVDRHAVAEAAMLVAPKCVSAPEIVTSRVEPAATSGGVTETTAGADGAATTCSAPIPRAVFAAGGDRDVAEAERGARRDGQLHRHARRRLHLRGGDRDPGAAHRDRAPGCRSSCRSPRARRRAWCRAGRSRGDRADGRHDRGQREVRERVRVARERVGGAGLDVRPEANTPPLNSVSSVNVRSAFSGPSRSGGFAWSGPAPGAGDGRRARARACARAGSASGGQLPESSVFSRSPFEA